MLCREECCIRVGTIKISYCKLLLSSLLGWPVCLYGSIHSVLVVNKKTQIEYKTLCLVLYSNKRCVTDVKQRSYQGGVPPSFAVTTFITVIIM